MKGAFVKPTYVYNHKYEESIVMALSICLVSAHKLAYFEICEL